MIGSAFTTGFFTSFALILAIGAQNAFVLKNGILQNHVFWVCMTCAISDALLITAGVAGFGLAVMQFPVLPAVMRYAGAAFLVFYGVSRLVAAYRGGESQSISGNSSKFWPTILTCLALTWLNPHVYLDTLGLIGAVSTQFYALSTKLAFGIGAVLASFTFFFALGYGARFLGPVMQTSTAWRVLDLLVGILMLFLAVGLIFG